MNTIVYVQFYGSTVIREKTRLLLVYNSAFKEEEIPFPSQIYA